MALAKPGSLGGFSARQLTDFSGRVRLRIVGTVPTTLRRDNSNLPHGALFNIIYIMRSLAVVAI